MKKLSLESIINFLIAGLAFLVPLFFLPFTTEYFEFNKLVLVSTFTLILLVLWGVKSVREGKVEFSRNPLNLALIVFLLATVVSAVFSQNRFVSFIGFYGRFTPSVFSALIFTILFFVVASNVKKESQIKMVLNALFLGIVFSSFFGLVRFFLPQEALKILPAIFRVRNFTTTGSPTILTIFAAFGVVLGLQNFISLKKESKFGKIFYWLIFGLTLIPLLTVVFINTLAGWAVLAVGTTVTLIVNRKEELPSGAPAAVALLGVLIISCVVRFVPLVSSQLGLPKDYGREITLGPRDSWVISSSSLRDFPFFGTGPGTFLYGFTRYRSLNFNNTDFWNVRFDRPMGEYFHILATMGLVGLIALIFVGIRFWHLAKDREKLPVAKALVLALAASLVFYHLSVGTAFLLFLALGLLVVSKEEVSEASVGLGSFHLGNQGDVGNRGAVASVFLVFSAVLSSTLLFGLGRMYAAEVFYRRALIATSKNDGVAAYNDVRRAIGLFPFFDIYRRDYAKLNMALANAIAAKKDLTDQDKTNISQLLQQAIRESIFASEVFGKGFVTNWETRASIYRNLLGVAKSADVWAIQAYQQGISLDPFNPILRLNLGGVYFSQKDYDNAINAFASAVSLKRDYANAHYNLAHALKEKGDIKNARTEFEITKSLVAKDSRDFETVESEIASLQSAEEALEGAVAGEKKEPTLTPQPPLTTPPQEATESATVGR